MTKLLISLVKKKSTKKTERSNIGILSGIVGIICNILLCIIKFVIGSLAGSVSITADAFNNLSDAASNIVTIAGAKLSTKPVDKEHPFGHGRIEYISALILSLFIFLMGFELGKSSIEKIIHPNDVKFSITYIIVLVSAIAVKMWMAYFNKRLYKMSDNINLKAVSQDSMNDCLSTGATIVSLILCTVLKVYWIDGVIGLCVAIIILLSGVDIVKEILHPLLGQPPEQEVVDGIKDIIMSEDLILGVHDLIVHDYGPGRTIASAHAEMPSNANVMDVHDVIDNVEQKIGAEMGIIICIHSDPIVVDDEELNVYKAMTERILKEYNSSYSFHDFRMVKGTTHTNLIFDVVIDYDNTKDKQQIKEEITKLFKAEDDKLNLVMTLEHSYV